MVRCVRVIIACLVISIIVIKLGVAARGGSSVDRTFIDVGGVKLHCIERGEGEPVVFIHGFSRNVELTWKETVMLDAVARNHRAIAFDCRGHGRSDKPRGETHYGTEMVEDVTRVLDHLDIERADLVGYSMGGRIALKFAATYPHRVRSVTLLGAGAMRPEDDHALWDEVAASLDRGEGMTQLVRHIMASAQPDVSEVEIQAMNEQSVAGNDPIALSSVARGYRNFAVDRRELGRIDAQMIAIIGDRDPFRPDVQRLAAMLPEVRVVELEGLDHLTLLSDDQAHQTLMAFLRRRRSE